MLEPALKWMEGLVKEASNVRIVPSQDPTVERILVAGEVHEFEIPPAARDHAFDDLDHLLQFVDGYPLSETDEPSVVLWYDEKSIVAVLDNDERRLSTATLAIKTTEEWDTVAGLKDWLDQKEFIRLLRFKLGSVLPPSALLEKVRKIKFENGVVTNQTSLRDRESMGREITSRLTTDTELPEELLVSVVRSEIAGLEPAPTYTVKLLLEIDSARGAFRLVPAPGELEAVRRQFVATLGRSMREVLPHIPAYNGRPCGA